MGFLLVLRARHQFVVWPVRLATVACFNHRCALALSLCVCPVCRDAGAIAQQQFCARLRSEGEPSFESLEGNGPGMHLNVAADLAGVLIIARMGGEDGLFNIDPQRWWP